MKRAVSYSRAFTLIELLVVLAVIGVIATILFPVFAAVRARAGQTACLSNLRQLHLAVMQYASDHDSLLPPYGTDFGSGFGSKATHQEVRNVDHAAELTTVLHPYIKEPALWFCPSDDLARTPSTIGFVNHRYTSYKTGHNWYAVIATQTLPVLGHTLIDHPDLGGWQFTADPVLFTDDLWNCMEAPGPLGSPEIPPAYSHQDRYNAIMFDGHAVSFRRDDASCLGQY